MNRESIELRIDELVLRKNVLIQKKQDLEKQIERVNGRIEEMWDWHASWTDKGDYGHRTLEDGVRVMKVPKFKTQDEMQRALEGKGMGIGETSEEEVLDAREARARKDGQIHVDLLNNNSPYAEDFDADSG